MAVWPRQMRPFPPVALPTRAARPHTAGFPRGSSPSSSFSSSQDLHAGALPQDRGMRGGAATQICPCQNTLVFTKIFPRHGPAHWPTGQASACDQPGPKLWGARARLQAASGRGELARSTREAEAVCTRGACPRSSEVRHCVDEHGPRFPPPASRVEDRRRRAVSASSAALERCELRRGLMQARMHASIKCLGQGCGCPPFCQTSQCRAQRNQADTYMHSPTTLCKSYVIP